METPTEYQPRAGTGLVVGGVIVMIVGLSLLLDRLDWDVRLSAHLWPLVLMVLGVARLMDPGRAPERRGHVRSGLWLLYLGVWGLINEYHLFGLTYKTSWPLLVIGAGLGIVWRALDAPRVPGPRQEL